MQTGYQGVTTLTKGLTYDGGMYEWYYALAEDIETEPLLGVNQELVTEPTLKAGKTWYGPVRVPDNSLGFIENQEKVKAGIYYKQKVDGYQPGDGRGNRIVLENMAHHRFIVVGKQRSGGFFLYIGSVESPLEFDHNYDGGKGYLTTSKTVFSFSGDSLQKALILPSFLGQTSTPAPGDVAPGGSSGTGDTSNQTETIPFVGTNVVTIGWNAGRKALFGNFPLIQVWFKDGSIYTLSSVPITCDAPPPATTLFTIDLTGVAEGFVQIK
ncbi:MAG: hypothetical protein M0Q26_06005 [Chitinophagaceae bacterium]|nr:hypothetical protein [Chitinophagaceae bacterium]MDP1763438.1 hypothetical protein [Sediminibacterium sp.]